MVCTLRNWIFKGCFISVFFSISINVLAMMLLMNPAGAGPMLLLTVWELYYIAVPLTTMMCYCYILAAVSEETGAPAGRRFRSSVIPYASFVVLVGLNPVTGLLFTVNPAGEFMDGPLFPFSYVIHCVYCLMMFAAIRTNRELIPHNVRKILLLFPSLIALVVLLQQFFRRVLLSGFVSVSVLLIAYLYLQNKRISEDQLTGLPNRTAYLKMLDHLIEKKQTIIVMVISLNDFKYINDKFGQANGDLFLKNIAAFLKTVTAGVYRFGGDKFAVIFEKQHLETAGSDICKIADRFSRSWEVPDCTCHIGASIGVAHYPATADNCRELVSMLESAVDRAKTSGSAQPIFCDRQIIERIRRRHMLFDQLRSVLESDRVEVYYQPLYSITDNCFTEVEALMRLRDENDNFLSPEEFIPIAEETGLIVEIGYVVLKKVCEYIRNLLQQGIEIQAVSINLSIVQLMREDMVPRVLQIVHANGISPSRLIFEITESILVSNYAVLSDRIKKLSEEGIRFALDDFGTGYSNLTHVIDLPFHVVKIDKSLIWDSMKNPRCYIMVRDMAKIFKNINLMVTAEGVETQEHDHFVRLCGCDRIQGFRYARPLLPELAAKYLGCCGPDEIS